MKKYRATIETIEVAFEGSAMLASVSHGMTMFELATRGLKEEHAACVKRIGCMVADPARVNEIEAYLSRIDNINQALIRLAGSRADHSSGIARL